MAPTSPSIHVAGDILNRNDFTSVTLASAPDFGLLGQAYPYSDFYATLTSLLHYDPAHQGAHVQGRMTSEHWPPLTSLTIQLVDATGAPLVDGSGNPITSTVHLLDSRHRHRALQRHAGHPFSPSTATTSAAAARSTSPPATWTSGATAGIQSVRAAEQSRAGQLFQTTARTSTSLSPATSTCFPRPSVRSTAANINVAAGGSVNVGSSTFSGSDQVARGIFTFEKSDVTVVAGAAERECERFAHRRLRRRQRHRRVAQRQRERRHRRARLGGRPENRRGRHGGRVQRTAVSLGHRDDSRQRHSGHDVSAAARPAFPTSQNTVGNILVETPRGNINASAGGIVQLPAEQREQPGPAIVEVLAGYELRDSLGHAVDAAHLSDGRLVSVSSGRNIDASGSGVIGSTVKLDASGSIVGVIFARNNIDIHRRSKT